jgi:hypothetical protein
VKVGILYLQRYPAPTRSRDRAKKARDAAEAMSDPDLKRTILEVAAGYERLAKRAEKQMLNLKANRRQKLRQEFGWAGSTARRRMGTVRRAQHRKFSRCHPYRYSWAYVPRSPAKPC